MCDAVTEKREKAWNLWVCVGSVPIEKTLLRCVVDRHSSLKIRKVFTARTGITRSMQERIGIHAYSLMFASSRLFFPARCRVN